MRAPALKQVHDDDGFLTPQDIEVVTREFDTHDPNAHERLVDHLPDTDELPRIEFAYDVTPPGGRKAGHKPDLSCVVPHPQKHWRGFIVRWERLGARARVGRDCGIEDFGFNFQAEIDRFTEDRRRKKDLLRVLGLRPLLPKVVAEIRQLHRHSSIELFDDRRQELRQQFSELYEALGVVSKRGGQLLTVEYERDHEAEHRRVERSEEGRKLLKACEEAQRKGPGVVRACNSRLRQWMEWQSPIYKTVGKNAGVLSAGSFITDPRLLGHQMAEAARAMAALAEEVTTNRSDHWPSSRAFGTTFRAIREAIGAIDDVAKRLDGGRKFSSEGNLIRISQWTQFESQASQPAVQQTVISRGRTLSSQDGEATWSFPSHTKLPALPLLEELRQLMIS